MKKPFSKPKIYTGGIPIKQWSALSAKAKKEALSKRWYVYFSYQDPLTGKLIRQTPISKNANRHKKMRERMSELKILQRNLLYLLNQGASPYKDNSELAEKITGRRFKKSNVSEVSSPTSFSFNGSDAIYTYCTPWRENTPATVAQSPATIEWNPATMEHDAATKNQQNTATKQRDYATTVQQTLVAEDNPQPTSAEVTQETPEKPEDSEEMTIAEAFEQGLLLKQRVQTVGSFSKFKSRVNRFKRWLAAEGLFDAPITSLTKKTVIRYLNEVLHQSSARNRNNTRTDLSSLFQVLEDNEWIPDNFVMKINVLKTVPVRHKSYTPDQETLILEYLEENDPVLLLFIYFIAYGFLRPIELCRLKVKDLDLIDRKMYVKAKNSPVKIKLIPEILLQQLPDLSAKNPEFNLFTPTSIGGPWETSEEDRRNYFTNRFRKVKTKLGLGTNYGLYSFRHTYISKIYRELAKNAAPMEVKSKLMLITGHSTLTALEKYLRDIDAALPEDYSDLLR